MTVGDFIKNLKEYDPGTVVRIEVRSNDEPVEDGDLLEITDSRSFMRHFGECIVIGDLPVE